MSAEKSRWSHLTVISLVAAVSLIAPTSARASTFSDWATLHGWTTGYVVPGAVYANYSPFSTTNPPIDSLTGIGNYDWATTPTTILDLSGNGITSVESDDFVGLGSLKTLDLYRNNIASIESGTFAGLGSLETLYLGGNQIASIEPGTFAGLGSLTHLELSWNQIATLESGAFTGLGNLTTWLGLHSNQITSIESGAFTGLDSLRRLDLQDNQITSIESGDFTGLGSLIRLDLHNNRITSLESGAFTGLGNLTTWLDMDSNQITSIESGDFTGLGNLTTLYFPRNQITSIKSGAFTGLGNLTSLHLGSNRITSIESGAFTGLGRLNTLYLNSNTALTNLKLDGADLGSLVHFDLTNDSNICRVSLKNARLNQSSLAALVDGGDLSYTGIGELPGITELDLSGVDFGAIVNLSPFWLMDHVIDLWLVDVLDLDASQLDTLLDNMAAMEDPNVEGTLYLTQADYNAFNAAGGGKLARWDAEAGHHVQIVPEPGAAVLLAALLLFVACRGRVRGFAHLG